MHQTRVHIPAQDLADFCRRHHILRLGLFGSVLRDDFDHHSDIDVLVEFKSGYTPGFGFVDLEDELTRLLGRRVDLNTPACLSRYFRDTLDVEWLYDAG